MSVLKKQTGFTIVELLVVIVLIGLVAGSFFRFFNLNLINYLDLQSDAASSAVIASQSQRIASVVRGTTGIISASGNDLQIYAYFYPSDTYVSLVHYYLNGAKTVLYADVTPMTSNPPQGTPITSKLKTYRIISNFYQPAGTNMFTYLDASFSVLPTPITDLNAIKDIQTNLAVKISSGGNQTNSLQVELRNRKTNL